MDRFILKLRIRSAIAIIGIALVYFLFLSPFYYFLDVSWITVSLVGIGIFLLNILHSTIILRRNREFPTIDDKRSRELVQREMDEVANKMSLKSPTVEILRSEVMNAYAIGLTEWTGKVFVTDSLVKNLNRDELRSTLAHEAAHIQNHDTLIMYVLYSPYSIVISLRNFLLRVRYSKSKAVSISATVIFGIVQFLSVLILILVRLVSRQREYIADTVAADTTDPTVEVTKLRKVGRYNQRALKDDRNSSATDILEQFSMSSGHTIFSTHPTIENRVKKIQEIFSLR